MKKERKSERKKERKKDHWFGKEGRMLCLKICWFWKDGKWIVKERERKRERRIWGEKEGKNLCRYFYAWRRELTANCFNKRVKKRKKKEKLSLPCKSLRGKLVGRRREKMHCHLHLSLPSSFSLSLSFFSLFLFLSLPLSSLCGMYILFRTKRAGKLIVPAHHSSLSLSLLFPLSLSLSFLSLSLTEKFCEGENVSFWPKENFCFMDSPVDDYDQETEREREKERNREREKERKKQRERERDKKERLKEGNGLKKHKFLSFLIAFSHAFLSPFLSSFFASFFYSFLQKVEFSVREKERKKNGLCFAPDTFISFGRLVMFVPVEKTGAKTSFSPSLLHFFPVRNKRVWKGKKEKERKSC